MSLLFTKLAKVKKNSKRNGKTRNTKYQNISKYASEIDWGSPFKAVSYSFLIVIVPDRVSPRVRLTG